MASLPVIPPGHEAFGRRKSKSHLLGQRPRGQSQPMPHAEPESAIDRDQRIGLVRNECLFDHVHTYLMRLSTCAAYQRPI